MDPMESFRRDTLQGYELVGAGEGFEVYRTPDGAPAIRCLRCGLVSHNPHDVENRFCGYCGLFHD